MQGIESLDNFKSFVSSLGGLGRYEDTYIVHAAEGETVVPMEVLDKNPLLKKRLFQSMVDMGIEPGRYIVGHELNSKNPVTGQPEFFFKQIGRRLRKAAADISGYAAPIIGAMYGPAAGAAAGAFLGQYKRENPGDPTQGLNMALRGGLAGLGSNIAGGQNPFLGKGLSGAEFRTPGAIFEQFFKPGPGETPFRDFFKGKGDKSNVRNYIEGLFKSKSDGGLNLSTEDIESISKMEDGEKILEILDKKKKGTFGDLSLGQIASLYGLGTAALGFLIDKTTDDQDVGLEIDDTEGNVLANLLRENVRPIYAAEGGGVTDLRQGGESVGPGTGTSDDIPAMLSDGEFVMTAKAVRGAGGGDRREGAKRMYEAMDKLEAQA